MITPEERLMISKMLGHSQPGELVLPHESESIVLDNSCPDCGKTEWR